MAIVAIGALIWDDTPPGLVRARPFILALVGLAAVLLILEWTGIH